MTGRERLTAVLRKQPKDRLPWAALVDNATLSLLPENLSGNSGIDFYRHLGCDILLLNGWNTQHNLRSPQHRWPEGVDVAQHRADDQLTTCWTTPNGRLTKITRGTHPAKYPVDSIEAARLYREMWEGVTYTVSDDKPALSMLDDLVGDDGIVTRFWGPSAIPLLLEQVMGTLNFYYLMADYPDEIDGLIRTIHNRQRDAFLLLADGPWESVTLIENTSTFYISPDIYRRYNMPHQREFVEIVKAKGKTAILHMCGHVHGILDLIKETQCDGIHALTPPPTGDTPWEDALDVLGDDLIIFGCLDPSIWMSGPIAHIPSALDRLITPRLRESNFVLCPFADGIPVDPARLYKIADWINSNGTAGQATIK